MHLRYLIAAFCLSSTMLVSAAHAASTVNQSGFTPLYLGVDQETATVDDSHANIVRIDMLAPGIHFATTPHSGPLSTIAQPLTQFVSTEKLQLAINANFFSPCCSTTPQPESLIGLQVDQGKLISPPTYTAGNENNVLVISRANKAQILTLNSPADLDLSRVYNAVAGSNILVEQSRNVAPTDAVPGSFDGANPRTAVGLSGAGRFLYFVTVDGRLTGYSVGPSLAETADLMIAVGCDTALNLDGGGSTEMVSALPGKAPFIVNTPSGGGEREDGSAIGFTAIPLPSQTFFDPRAIDLLLRQLGLGG